MSIVSLKIRNFLSISDVEIKPGQVNLVVGKNNQGKTTIIKALEFAIRGSTDGSMVKQGENAAEVTVELADDLSIRRRLSAEGKQSVEVMKGPGVLRAPQTILDQLVDAYAFNPLELLDPKKRPDAIMRVIDLKIDPATLADELGTTSSALPPIDWKAHGLLIFDQMHRYYYQRRAEANREMGIKKQRWETYKRDLPAETKLPTFSREELGERRATLRQELETANREIESARDEEKERKAKFLKIESCKDDMRMYSLKLEALRLEIEAYTKAIDERKAKINALAKEVEAPSIDVSRAVERKGNVETKLQELLTHEKDIERAEAVIAQRRVVDDMEKEFNAAEKLAKDLDLKVHLLAGDLKTKYMSKADMPIAGLEYRNSEFLVNGIPVDNLSSSHSLKLAVGVARRLAKRTKIICIDGAEMLDEEAYASLREEIDGDGYTYFLTKVGGAFAVSAKKNDNMIPMENGRVVQ